MSHINPGPKVSAIAMSRTTVPVSVESTHISATPVIGYLAEGRMMMTPATIAGPVGSPVASITAAKHSLSSPNSMPR